LRNTEIALLSDFQSKFFRLFGIKPTITPAIDRAYISSKPIYFLLTNAFGSFYCNEWKFSNLFKSKKLKKAWLRAVFDCEAWVEVDKATNRRIGIEMVNLNGMKTIKQILNQFGIASILKPKKKGKIFRLEIFGKENLIRFQKEINFLHPKKKERLQNAIDSYINYKWVFPKEHKLLIKFILRKLKGKSNKIPKVRVRVCSNMLVNLKKMKYNLNKLFGVASVVSKKRFNGNGVSYYELFINNRADVVKIIRRSNI
jgi:hypothetical protein